MKRLSFGAALGVAFALFSTFGALAQSATQLPFGPITDKTGRPVNIEAVIQVGYDSSSHLPCIIGTGATCQLQTNATGGGGGGSLSATAHATAPSDLTEGQTSAGLVVDLSHHLFTRALQDGAWNITNITGAISLPTGAATAANQTTANGYLASLVSGGATAALQSAVQANAGSDASKAVAVQGVTGGKPVPVTCSGCVGSSSTQPFAPDSFTPTTLAPTTSGLRSTQLGVGTTVQIVNDGTVAVPFAIGSSSVSATVSSTALPPGIGCNFYYASGGAYVYGITASGTGHLSISSGSGGAPGCFIYADMSSSAAVKGTTAAGSTAADAPIVEGCRAATTSPTPVTDGQVTYAQCGPGGKRIVEFAPGALQVKGAGNTTSNTATTIIAAQGSGVKIYVTQIQCSNMNASTDVMVTLNDSASSPFIVPHGSGNNPPAFLVPLDVAANTALTFTPSATGGPVYCNAQGFKGP